MTKPIIGIVLQPSFTDNDEVFQNRYYVLDNYTQAIYQNGGIPIGLVMNNLEVIKENLALCDGILIPGGIVIKDYHLKIIDYAYQNNIPYLGICMGMQALAMYSLKENHETKVLQMIAKPHKHNYEITKQTKDKLGHKVKIIDKESQMYQIFQKEVLDVNSFHNYEVTKVGPDFKIVGLSDDNKIEIIECKNPHKFMVGVQWHPELLPEMTKLLKTFIEKSGNNHANKNK